MSDNFYDFDDDNEVRLNGERVSSRSGNEFGYSGQSEQSGLFHSNKHERREIKPGISATVKEVKKAVEREKMSQSEMDAKKDAIRRRMSENDYSIKSSSSSIYEHDEEGRNKTYWRSNNKGLAIMSIVFYGMNFMSGSIFASFLSPLYWIAVIVRRIAGRSEKQKPKRDRSGAYKLAGVLAVITNAVNFLILCVVVIICIAAFNPGVVGNAVPDNIKQSIMENLPLGIGETIEGTLDELKESTDSSMVGYKWSHMVPMVIRRETRFNGDNNTLAKDVLSFADGDGHVYVMDITQVPGTEGESMFMEQVLPADSAVLSFCTMGGEEYYTKYDSADTTTVMAGAMDEINEFDKRADGSFFETNINENKVDTIAYYCYNEQTGRFGKIYESSEDTLDGDSAIIGLRRTLKAAADTVNREVRPEEEVGGDDSEVEEGMDEIKVVPDNSKKSEKKNK